MSEFFLCKKKKKKEEGEGLHADAGTPCSSPTHHPWDHPCIFAAPLKDKAIDALLVMLRALGGEMTLIPNSQQRSLISSVTCLRCT